MDLYIFKTKRTPRHIYFLHNARMNLYKLEAKHTSLDVYLVQRLREFLENWKKAYTAERLSAAIVKSIYTNIVEKFTTLTAAFVLINDTFD